LIHVRAAMLLAILGGCVVIRPPDVDERPRWRIANGETFDAGCVTARGYIRKSGKQGFGVAIQLRSRGDCTFAVTAARLVFPHGPTVTATPLTVALTGHSQLYAWLPVPFDNDDAWNSDRNDATLELTTAAGVWQLSVHQR
jgi:hypothetical protein